MKVSENDEGESTKQYAAVVSRLALSLVSVCLLSWCAPARAESARADSTSEAAAPEAARPTHARVRLVVAPGTPCIAPRTLEELTERELGRDVFVSETSDLLVSVTEASSSDVGRLAVELRLSLPNGAEAGRRVLAAPRGDCEALMSRVSLALALMVDLRSDEVPVAASSPAPTGTAGAESPPVATPTSPPAAPKGNATSASSSAFAFDSTRLDGLVSFGALPAPALAFGLAVRARVAVLGVELRGRICPDRTFREESGAFTSRGAELGAFVCPLLLGTRSARSVTLEACVGGGVSWLRTTGVSFSDNRSAELLAFEPGVALGVETPTFGILALRLEALVEAPLPRGRMVFVDESGADASVYEVPPITETLALGIVFRP